MRIETLGVYLALLGTVAIAAWATIGTRKRTATTREYFTAQGRLDRKLIFFSVFATTFSAFTVVGLPAMFYAHGIGAFWFMWIGIALTPFTLKFIGTRIVKLSVERRDHNSPVGLLTSGYGSPVLTGLVSLATIVVLFPYLILQVSGVGKFLVSISDGGLPYASGTLICCIIVGSYMYVGGALADAKTDLAQGVILILGTLVVGGVLISSAHSDAGNQFAALSGQGLLAVPGPHGFFSFRLLLSFAVIFTLISVATPQVSQKLMGCEDPDQLKPLMIWYPVAGTIVVALAGLLGLYAAANLDVATPDFVTGDVIRHLASGGGPLSLLVFLVAVVFVTGIIAAAISTIDSLLLAVSGIVSDNIPAKEDGAGSKLKLLSLALLLLGFLLSHNPPRFVVDLARVQLSGLMAILPCLLGPLFGIRDKAAGWLALGLGFLPLLLAEVASMSFGGFDVGLVGLLAGTAGLLLALAVRKVAPPKAAT